MFEKLENLNLKVSAKSEGFRAGQSSVYRTRLELKLVQRRSKGAVPQLGIPGCRVYAYAFFKSFKVMFNSALTSNKVFKNT